MAAHYKELLNKIVNLGLPSKLLLLPGSEVKEGDWVLQPDLTFEKITRCEDCDELGENDIEDGIYSHMMYDIEEPSDFVVYRSDNPPSDPNETEAVFLSQIKLSLSSI